MFNDARLTSLIANTLSVLAVLALLGGLVFWAAKRPVFNITRLYLQPLGSESLQYVSPATVRATIAGRLAGNFFFIDLNTARDVIESTPWVRKAQLRRVWPNALLVRVEEQQPLALWNQDEMINTWGEAFSANQGELDDGLHLPRLSGPPDSERLVVQRFAEMARWFAPLGVGVRELALSPRYAWDAQLSNGVQLMLGRDPAAEAVDPHGRSGARSFAQRIEGFVQAWPALQARLDGRPLQRVDLRYPSGFAIRLNPNTDNPAQQNKHDS
ncbi:MAG: cell division protein FtsQ/DivIB [Castellaniella sp.]